MVRGPDDVVAPPPTVRGDTVRDWLRYYTNREHLWDDVVAEFYARAADDPLVAPYFTGVDLPLPCVPPLPQIQVMPHVHVRPAQSGQFAPPRPPTGDPAPPPHGPRRG